jgi:hypothetical protein
LKEAGMESKMTMISANLKAFIVDYLTRMLMQCLNIFVKYCKKWVESQLPARRYWTNRQVRATRELI